jgi:methyl-accepting chemotaxis protein
VASHDIRTKVQGIQSTTVSAVTNIQRIRDVVKKIRHIVGSISGSITEQSSSTDEINGAVTLLAEETSRGAGQCKDAGCAAEKFSGQPSIPGQRIRGLAN